MFVWLGFPFFFFFFLITYICFSFCWNLSFCFFFFLRTCSFLLSLFLLQSFSAFKYHISYHFNPIFLFYLGSIAHYLSTFPLIFFFCSSLLFCSIVILVVHNYELWFYFHLIWFEIFCQFLVPLALSFLFSSFLVVGCRQLMTWSGYLLHFWRQLEL